MSFLGRGVNIPHNKLFKTFPHVELEKYSPRYTRKLKGLGELTGPPVYPAELVYPAVSGGKSVIRLGLGKLLVNRLQVVKRTNIPLTPEQFFAWSKII